MHVCMYVQMCVYLQKPEEGFDFLDLELQVTVSCPTWELGPELWSCARTASLLNFIFSAHALICME